ncbi:MULTISPECIES: hypothetical protein [Sphingobacterium]|uniref:hypothetical protein n=1 Tax=Sphingobacterium TaxID=28453 RepID=UPI0013DA3B48|nr:MULTISPECIES: hypothetical protein [unclassified Sphingobacterium]
MAWKFSENDTLNPNLKYSALVLDAWNDIIFICCDLRGYPGLPAPFDDLHNNSYTEARDHRKTQ